MIILDTNVISAMMRSTGNDAALNWLDAQAPGVLWTTSITVFEIILGLSIGPSRHLMERLAHKFELMLSTRLNDRVLAYDAPAARLAAGLSARRKLAGRSIDLADTQIAGIALAHGATLATRNIRHFEDAGIDLIDPWNAG